jgi:hypothetical protein
MARVRRKRRTREHVIADLSVHHVEGHVLRCGWIVEKTTHDYGIDLQLVTFDRAGEYEVGEILMQLKASDRLRVRPGQTTIVVRIDLRDLAVWLHKPMPVILIVNDARKNVAYWLYVQSYFRRQQEFNLFTAGQTITVYLPTQNVVTPGALRQFARFRDRVVAQLRDVRHDEDATDPLR